MKTKARAQSEHALEVRIANIRHELETSKWPWPGKIGMDFDVRKEGDGYRAYVKMLPKSRLPRAGLLKGLPLEFKLLVNRGPTVVGKSREEVLREIGKLFNSNLAVALARMFGDSVEVRMFAFDVVSKFKDYERKYKGRLKTLAELKKDAKNFAVSAEATARLAESNLHGELRLLADELQKEKLRVIDRKRKTTKLPRITISEAEAVWRARTNVAHWPALIETLSSLASCMREIANGIDIRRGPTANREHNYTPVCILADAWVRNFGGKPSDSENGKFQKVVNLCLNALNRSKVDLRAGLKYWRTTYRQRTWGANRYLLNPAALSASQDAKKATGSPSALSVLARTIWLGTA